MAAISPSIQVLQLLDKNVGKIAINFTTGKFVWTDKVQEKALQSGRDTLVKGVALGMLFGGFTGALVGIAKGMILEGLTVGMGVGTVWVGAGSLVYVTVEGAVKLYQVKREFPEISRQTTRLVEEAFRNMARNQSIQDTEDHDIEENPYRYHCPISNELYHIPVSTMCHAKRKRGKIIFNEDGSITPIGPSHTMDYQSLLHHMKRSSRCPILGCEREIDLSEIVFEEGISRRMKVIIENAFSHLNSQLLAMSGPYNERDVDLPNLQELSTRIEEGQWQIQDVYFLRSIIIKEVKIRNDKVKRTFEDMCKIIRSRHYENQVEKINCIDAASRIMMSYMINLPDLRARDEIEDGKEE